MAWEQRRQLLQNRPFATESSLVRGDLDTPGIVSILILLVDVRSLRSHNRREQDEDTRFARVKPRNRRRFQPRTMQRRGPHRLPDSHPAPHPSRHYTGCRRGLPPTLSASAVVVIVPAPMAVLAWTRRRAQPISLLPSSSPPPSARALTPCTARSPGGLGASSLARSRSQIGVWLFAPPLHPPALDSHRLHASFVIVSPIPCTPTRGDRLPACKRSADPIGVCAGILSAWSAWADPSSLPAWSHVGAGAPDCARGTFCSS